MTKKNVDLEKKKKYKPHIIKLLYIVVTLCWSFAISGCRNSSKDFGQELPIIERKMPVPIKGAMLSTTNGELIQKKAKAIRTKEYIGIDDFEYIAVLDKAYFRVYSYKNVEGVFQYLGLIGWTNGSLSSDKIKQEYSEVTDIRVELKMDNNSNHMQTIDTVSDSKNIFLINGEKNNYQIGTILAADGKSDLTRNTRFFMKEYLPLMDYEAIALNRDYCITWFAYSFNDEIYNYLGTSDWLSTGYISLDSIREKFPNATHFRFSVRSIQEDFSLTDLEKLTNVVEKSKIRLFKENFVPEYEVGEIYEKCENAGQNNDESIMPINEAMVYNEYIDLDTITSISLKEGFQLAYYTFNEKREYLGYNGWLGAQINLATSTIIEQFCDACYIKLVIRTRTGEDIREDEVVSFCNKAGSVTSYAYYKDINEKYARLSCNKIAKLKSTQDGSVYQDMILCMNANQTGFLYSKDKQEEIATVTLNGDLRVHCNSVCFGNQKFDEEDDFPLLYCNVYNAYEMEDNRMEGVCGVYRLIKQDNGDYAGNLIQVIKIDFTENLTLWKSKINNGDVRSYGNFIVDSDDSKMIVFVPRDAENVTRFFCFKLPRFSDGLVSSKHKVKTVELDVEDIISQFDERYIHYPQGAAYGNGRIYMLEGMVNGKAQTKLSVIDLSAKKICATIDLDDMGITSEPELIALDGDDIYLTDMDGILYKIREIEE